MTNQIQKPITMRRWILFNTYGWLIGILLIVGFAVVLEVLLKTGGESGGQAVVGIGMGAGLGFMQWLALRKHLAAAGRFFLFTLIGFSAAFILRDAFEIAMKSISSNTKISVESTIPFAVLAGAFISSWLQYKFIFRAITNKASGWIFHSVLGWLTATIVTMSTAFLNIKTGEDFPVFLIVCYALLLLSIGGPILGYITGRFILETINKTTG